MECRRSVAQHDQRELDLRDFCFNPERRLLTPRDSALAARIRAQMCPSNMRGKWAQPRVRRRGKEQERCNRERTALHSRIHGWMEAVHTRACERRGRTRIGRPVKRRTSSPSFRRDCLPQRSSDITLRLPLARPALPACHSIGGRSSQLSCAALQIHREPAWSSSLRSFFSTFLNPPTMLSLYTYLAAAAGLTGLAHAADTPAPKVVGFDIAKSRRHALANLARRNLARRDTVSADLANYRTLYQINVTVGTPGQRIGLQIDTGSSDVWFPYQGSTQCMQGYCESAFDPGASSTFEDVGRGEFQIQYVDGTEISGDYVRDVLAIGDTQIRNMTMAVATDADNTPEGIMGVGFIQGETLASQENITYPNVPVQLVNQGFINSVAYSLWLNDLGTFIPAIQHMHEY